MVNFANCHYSSCHFTEFITNLWVCISTSKTIKFLLKLICFGYSNLNIYQVETWQFQLVIHHDNYNNCISPLFAKEAKAETFGYKIRGHYGNTCNVHDILQLWSRYICSRFFQAFITNIVNFNFVPSNFFGNHRRIVGDPAKGATLWRVSNPTLNTRGLACICLHSSLGLP